MKIAIEGKIVDTDNIYSISNKILSGSSPETYKPDFYFEIESFNDNIIRVSIETYDGIEYGHKSLSSSEERNNYLISLSESNKNKIEKMRQDIVNIWSENQSKIPTFDIKKY